MIRHLRRCQKRKKREVRHLHQHYIALLPLAPPMSFYICINARGGRGGRIVIPNAKANHNATIHCVFVVSLVVSLPSSFLYSP